MKYSWQLFFDLLMFKHIIPIFLITNVGAQTLPECNTKYCNCEVYDSRLYRFICGKNASESEKQLEVSKFFESITIKCPKNIEESDYMKWIKDIQINENIKKFEILSCPISKNTFDEIFNIFKSKIITWFSFSHSDKPTLTPDHFAKLNTVRRMFLKNNSMTELSEQLFQHMSSLEFLNLDQVGNFKSLPKKIFQPLKNLKELLLPNIGLTTLDEKIFESLGNLEELNLQNNYLSSLPKSIYTLTNLNALTLDDNNIKLSSKSFTNLTSLVTLSLENNNLVSLPQGLFNNLTNLEYLYLGNNQLSKLDESLFENLDNLKTLHINDNELTDLPLQLFCYKLKNLKYLKMDNNKFRMDSNILTSSINSCNEFVVIII